MVAVRVIDEVRGKYPAYTTDLHFNVIQVLVNIGVLRHLETHIYDALNVRRVYCRDLDGAMPQYNVIDVHDCVDRGEVDGSFREQVVPANPKEKSPTIKRTYDPIVQENEENSGNIFEPNLRFRSL